MKKQTKSAAQAAQANQIATAQVTNAQAKAQAHNRYGFSSIVKKALRAAVDEVAGVVEPQPKAKKQAKKQAGTSGWLVCANVLGAIVGYQRIGEDGNGTGKIYTESEYKQLKAAEAAEAAQ